MVVELASLLLVSYYSNITTSLGRKPQTLWKFPGLKLVLKVSRSLTAIHTWLSSRGNFLSGNSACQKVNAKELNSGEKFSDYSEAFFFLLARTI